MNNYHANKELENEITEENLAVESNTVSEFFNADDLVEFAAASQAVQKTKSKRHARDIEILEDAIKYGILQQWKEAINANKVTYAQLHLYLKKHPKVKLKMPQSTLREFLQTEHGFKKRKK